MYSDIFCKVYNEFGWNYYPEIFGQQLLSWLKARGFSPKNALDLGCGTGVLCRILKDAGMEAMGMEIGSYSVEKKTNGGDVEIICLTYSASMQGVGMKMYQYIILGEKKHYTVTVTEMTDIDDVVDEVFKSIRID